MCYWSQKTWEVKLISAWDYLGSKITRISYAPLFIEKKTVVVGNDELALRAAAELATVAKHVTLVRSVPQLEESALYKKLCIAKNVTVLDRYQVVEVKGDEYARSLVVKTPEGKIEEISADGTFIEMALQPNTQMVKGLVDMDEQGHIKVDNGNRTSTPGIFAAGDATVGHAEQVLIAIGEGAKAGLSAFEYLLPLL